MIKVSQQTESYKELEEGFFCDYGVFYSISKDCVIAVGRQTILVELPKNGVFSSTCALMANPKGISQKEFKKELKATIDKINSLAGISNVPTLQLQEA